MLLDSSRLIMWKQDPATNQWYKRVSSGFLTLTFVIYVENSLYILDLADTKIKSNKLIMCSDNIEQAKKVADQHIRNALKWS